MQREQKVRGCVIGIKARTQSLRFSSAWDYCKSKLGEPFPTAYLQEPGKWRRDGLLPTRIFTPTKETRWRMFCFFFPSFAIPRLFLFWFVCLICCHPELFEKLPEQTKQENRHQKLFGIK